MDWKALQFWYLIPSQNYPTKKPIWNISHFMFQTFEQVIIQVWYFSVTFWELLELYKPFLYHHFDRNNCKHKFWLYKDHFDPVPLVSIDRIDCNKYLTSDFNMVCMHHCLRLDMIKNTSKPLGHSFLQAPLCSHNVFPTKHLTSETR